MKNQTMNYRSIQKLTPAQIDDLHTLYRREWWTKDRTKEEIEIMLEHTDFIFGLVDERERLAGFARVLSDRIFKAEIYDVIVDPAHRGRGLGKRLMEEILAHPDLRRVKQFNLQCLEEMKPFYEELGFADLSGELVYMRLGRSAGLSA